MWWSCWFPFSGNSWGRHSKRKKKKIIPCSVESSFIAHLLGPFFFLDPIYHYSCPLKLHKMESHVLLSIHGLSSWALSKLPSSSSRKQVHDIRAIPLLLSSKLSTLARSQLSLYNKVRKNIGQQLRDHVFQVSNDPPCLQCRFLFYDNMWLNFTTRKHRSHIEPTSMATSVHMCQMTIMWYS